VRVGRPLGHLQKSDGDRQAAVFSLAANFGGIAVLEPALHELAGIGLVADAGVEGAGRQVFGPHQKLKLRHPPIGEPGLGMAH
jgi:hypothetical protein